MPFLKKIGLEAAEVGFQSPIISSLIKAKEQQERVRQELILIEQAKIRAQEQERLVAIQLELQKKAQLEQIAQAEAIKKQQAEWLLQQEIVRQQELKRQEEQNRLVSTSAGSTAASAIISPAPVSSGRKSKSQIIIYIVVGFVIAGVIYFITQKNK